METTKLTEAIDKLKTARRQLNQLLTAKDKPLPRYTHIELGYRDDHGGGATVKFAACDCPPHLWQTALVILETHFRAAVASAEKELREAMKELSEA